MVDKVLLIRVNEVADTLILALGMLLSISGRRNSCSDLKRSKDEDVFRQRPTCNRAGGGHVLLNGRALERNSLAMLSVRIVRQV